MDTMRKHIVAIMDIKYCCDFVVTLSGYDSRKPLSMRFLRMSQKFESSNARHIKNGTGHKVLSHFLFESDRTRTGSIYISFCLRSTPVGSKPTSTGCCEPLLNACHRHAATSNARYVERLETLKKINGFRLFLCLLN